MHLSLTLSPHASIDLQFSRVYACAVTQNRSNYVIIHISGPQERRYATQRILRKGLGLKITWSHDFKLIKGSTIGLVIRLF